MRISSRGHAGLQRAVSGMLCLTAAAAMSACGADFGGLREVTANANQLQTPNALISASGSERLQLIASAPQANCLAAQGGNQVAAGASVGVLPCSHSLAQQWLLEDDGTLTLANGLRLVASDTNAPAFFVMPTQGSQQSVSPTLANTAVHLTLARGHLARTETISGTQASVLVPISSSSNGNFVPLQAKTIDLSSQDASTTWSLGHARIGAQNSLIVDGFAIRLVNQPTLCLTGAGSTAGVEPCQGATTQAWTLNAQGTFQLGGLCLSIDSTGTPAQGTAVVFATCNAQDTRQLWVTQASRIALGGFFLAPKTLPASTDTFTSVRLSGAATAWHLGL